MNIIYNSCIKRIIHIIKKLIASAFSSDDTNKCYRISW